MDVRPSASYAASVTLWLASSTLVGTGRMRGAVASRCSRALTMERATATEPSMLWVFSVKQLTTVLGSCTVQMPAVSLRPVRLSRKTKS